MPMLPKDIYPDSGFRLPTPNRDQMNDEEKKIYDKLVDPAVIKLAGLEGPIGITLQNPKLADLDWALVRYLRYDAGLNKRISDLAILVTARKQIAALNGQQMSKWPSKMELSRRLSTL